MPDTNKPIVIYTNPSSLNTDGEGVYTEYLCDNATALAALPTQGDVTGGPRSGSLALCLADGEGRRALYVLSSARTWEFLKVVS